MKLTPFTFDLATEVGIFSAYHRTIGNRIIHWITTFSILICLKLFLIEYNYKLIMNVGVSDLIFILSIGYYIACKEIIVTIIMSIWFYLLTLIAQFILQSFENTNHFIWLIIGLLLFTLQISIGHLHFEGRENFSNAVQAFVAFAYFGPLFEGQFFYYFFFKQKFQTMNKVKQNRIKMIQNQKTKNKKN
eukprot:TRINITY_DN506_c4_g1_i1.p1 TRINITY_DN506_c4_g1~~TRINITY_DN506_c4_g1_i1.p1  ORF type:complete len:189 (-),score=46.13 TRINITY_DN506_c4_g1_i1:39-605(-)